MQQYKQFLKQETKEAKKIKQDFLIWQGRLLDEPYSTLPKDTSAVKAIVSLG